MSVLRDLHHEAVRIADEAYAAKRHGRELEAETLFIAAFDVERQAAQIVAAKYDAEPTRGLLYSGAAALAYQGRQYREAERMIGAGLAGNPPSDIVEDLRDLLDKVNIGRQQSLRSLSSSQLHMSIAGRSVRSGFGPIRAFSNRIQFVSRLLTRTADRLSETEFRVGDQAEERVRIQYPSFAEPKSLPEMKDSFSEGEPTSQFTFDTDVLTLRGSIVDVVGEVMACLDLFENRRQADLRTRISDLDYYNNFVALSRQIAPDGADISLVGFSTGANGTKRNVNMIRSEGRPSPEIAPLALGKGLLDTCLIEGQLCAATSTNPDKEEITIIDSDHKAHRIVVPKGIGDIVTAYWEENVWATVVRTKAPRVVSWLQDLRKAI